MWSRIHGHALELNVALFTGPGQQLLLRAGVVIMVDAVANEPRTQLQEELERRKQRREPSMREPGGVDSQLDWPRSP